jgi:hypothetical protein
MAFACRFLTVLKMDDNTADFLNRYDDTQSSSIPTVRRLNANSRNSFVVRNQDNVGNSTLQYARGLDSDSDSDSTMNYSGKSSPSHTPPLIPQFRLPVIQRQVPQ